MANAEDDIAGRFTAKATAESHFSWLRTRLSVERTLMSWVRTAVALIGFGFTIVQFFERFHAMNDVAPAMRPQAPRYLGLSLIASGVLALVISVQQYRGVIGYLRGPDFEAVAGIGRVPHPTPLLAVAFTLIVIGVSAFIAVFTRAL
jgi:putative membrane protein